MKEIPILFSTPMVQAILDDRKTMTRRIVNIDDLKAHPDWFRYVGNSQESDFPRPAIKYDDRIWYEWQLTNSNGSSWLDRCKWKAGDILWVRETWQWMEGFAGSGYYVFKSDFKLKDGEWQKEISKKFHDVEVVRFWKPSIHMAKEAARIWLQVTDVRVERLQDITEEDAIAEGVKPASCESNKGCPSQLCKESCAAIGEWWNYNEPKGEGFPAYSARESFETLWQSINGAESWEANPWVWVISYKILSTAGKPDLQTLKAIA